MKLTVWTRFNFCSAAVASVAIDAAADVVVAVVAADDDAVAVDGSTYWR